MLYGFKNVQEDVLSRAKEMVKKIGGKLIFGSMVGSIGRGIQSFDSDYDTRFLYIKDSFPQEVFYPDQHDENELVHRYFELADGDLDISIEKYYDRLPIWEFTSFLQFLINPVLGTTTRDSLGLYHIVEYTMFSPFAWDPYGLQGKLNPLIELCFDKFSALSFYKKMIKTHYNYGCKIRGRHLTYLVWASLSINWILETGTKSPLHFDTLCVLIEDKSLKLVLDKYLHAFYLGRKQMHLDNFEEFRTISTFMYIEEIPKEINAFINQQFFLAQLALNKLSKLSIGQKKKHSEIINEIYRITNDAVNNKFPIKNISC